MKKKKKQLVGNSFLDLYYTISVHISASSKYKYTTQYKYKLIHLLSCVLALEHHSLLHVSGVKIKMNRQTLTCNTAVKKMLPHHLN